VCHGTRIDSRALEPRRVSKRRRVPQSDAIEVPLLSSRHAIIERHRLCSGSFDLVLFPRISRTVKIRSIDDHLQSSSFEILLGCNRLKTIDERKFQKRTVLDNCYSLDLFQNSILYLICFKSRRDKRFVRIRRRIRRREYFRRRMYSSSLFLPALL